MQSRVTRILKNIFLAVCSTIIILFFLTQTIWNDGYSYHEPKIVYLTEDARLLLQDGTTLALQNKGEHFLYEEAKPGEVLTVIMTLPEILGDDFCISILSSEQDIGVYVDGALREYYDDKTYRTIDSYSTSRYVIAPLTAADSGKEIRITYETSLNKLMGTLACPMLGTRADLMQWILKSYFWQIVSGVLLFAVSIVYIVIGVVINHNRNSNHGLCYLGIFSIIVALRIFCESGMRVFYCRNLNAMNLMMYIALMVAPIPILIYFNDLMRYRYQKVYNTVISLCMLNTLICLVITVLGVAELREIMLPTYMMIVVTSIIFMFCYVDCVRMKEMEAPIAVGISIGGFITTISIEGVNLLFLNIEDIGRYIGYGILVFILMLGYAAEKSWVVQWKDYRKAIEENAFKNAFLANMSHEIKTPINTILGMNEMISRESENQNVKRYVDHIYEAGKQLLSLVNNILDYTKLESGKMQIVPIRYEMGQLLSNLINSVNMKAEEKRLRFDIDVDESIPCILYGDELRIRQAVFNLLNNALKYTREGSISLQVRAERTDQKEICLYISVADTGMGIRKEDRERLFDSFVRLDEKRNRSIDGTGLGMTITRQIVNMMQGNISLESEYGKGSVFTLSFKQKIVDDIPLGRFEDWYRATLGMNQYPEERYQAIGVRILAIDDNEMNLEVIRGLLKKTGVHIDTVFSGEEGLAKAKNEKYDLILLDHMMPGMDGIETLQQLQQIADIKEHRLPIIALTANAVIGVREEYLQKGFTDYIAKPVDYRALMMILRKYLPDKIKKCTQTDNIQITYEEYLEQKGIHMKEAMKYAGDDLEQYIHLLAMFVSARNRKRQDALQQAYETGNWKDYTTYVHALKNEARTIGADGLADMAYEHEQKSKEGDIAFLQKSYNILMNEWEKTKESIAFYLELSQEAEETLEPVIKRENKLGENVWKEMLEQTISCLTEYKKKEALGLLVKLSEDKSAGGIRQNLEQAIEAVREYDYERAIHILREIRRY